MGNLCGSDASAAPQQLGEGKWAKDKERDKKKKKKKKQQQSSIAGDESDLVELVENPMVSKKSKKRESTVGGGQTDTLSATNDSSLSSPTKAKKDADSSSSSPKSSNIHPLMEVAPPPPAKVEVENPGKFGWLFRENEQYEVDKSEDPYLKKWVSISNGKLMYCSEQPVDGVKSLAEGFIELTPTVEVKLRHIEKLIHKSSTSRGGDSAGNYCFMVRDQELSMTFATETDVIRDEWISQIKSAMAGTVYNAPSCSMLSPVPETASADEKVVELPRKFGELKKYSMGGMLGVKTVQKRWFRLDGGDLRYYNDKDMRPATLKRALNMSSAAINDATEANIIELKFEDTGDSLRMEATTPVIATEWREALRETLLSLRVRGASGAQTKRRLNLVDVSSDVDENTETKTPNKAGGGRTIGKPWGKTVYEKTPKVIELIRNCMQGHFLLKTVKEVNTLIEGMNKVIKLPGDVIIAQGTAGDLFYILETGQVDVIIGGNKVGKIDAGKSFGDMALLNSSARMATIRARQLCHLWSLDRKVFRRVLADQEKKTLADKVAFLKKVKLFEKLNDSTLEKIADVMQIAQFEPKQKIFKQGESGDCFYMVQTGKVSIVKSFSYTGTSKELCQMGPQRYFGDMALIDDKPRSATAIAIEPLVCWTIDRSNFTNLLGSIDAAVAESIGVSILKNVKLLKTLNEKQLVTISRCLTNVKFEQGVDIIRQGDDGDSFYMISEGQVSVQINCIEVGKIPAGGCFGEGALMRNDKRAATVTTLTPTTCLVLSRPDFNRLLGPLDAIMKAEAEKRAKPPEETGFLTSMFGGSSEKKNVQSIVQAASASPTRNKMFDLEQLIRVKIIGRGTFSKVYLVRHAQNDKEFALKVLYKDTLASFHQEQAVFAERDIMMQFDNPFITALFATFQDANALYIVQQFVPGGDVWMMLKNNLVPKSRFGGITTDHVTFYASNALCAIGHLHEHDILYRDLKPENLGIDSTGFLKIYDFGSSKKLPGDVLTNTMVGTPEYLAPEMVMSRGHNRAMDLWAFGILLYEMFTGSTPFYNSNPATIYQYIMESQLQLETAFPKGFSPEGKDIIKKLLVENPGMRIGMLRNGISDVWKHPFFRNYPLAKVQARDFSPPYRPDENLKNRTELADLIIGDFESDLVPHYKGNFDFSAW